MLKIIGTSAIFFYLIASVNLGRKILSSGENSVAISKFPIFITGFLALFLHGIILLQVMNISTGFNFGFYNALSLISWCISLVIILLALGKPVENLIIVIFPLSALSILLSILFPTSHILAESVPLGIRIHILLSVFAYSLLTIAALQAVLLALQDRQISKKHPASIMQLPPMQVMEDLLMQIISVGFFMLSLSLVSGLLFIQDIMAQHLAHKTVFSILAWLIFGILLWGHWTKGWRGMRAIRWTIGGFISLLLAYFGSKLVLEIILHRV